MNWPLPGPTVTNLTDLIWRLNESYLLDDTVKNTADYIFVKFLKAK